MLPDPISEQGKRHREMNYELFPPRLRISVARGGGGGGGRKAPPTYSAPLNEKPRFVSRSGARERGEKSRQMDSQSDVFSFPLTPLPDRLRCHVQYVRTVVYKVT